MSRSLNKAQLIGNLGADPEIRTTASNRRVANFSLATSRTFTGANGTPQTRTQWHRVVVWGAPVDIIERYTRKGTRLFVEGEIEYRSYEDRDGVMRYVTEINAQEIMLLDSADRRSGPPADDVPHTADLVAEEEQLSMVGSD